MVKLAAWSIAPAWAIALVAAVVIAVTPVRGGWTLWIPAACGLCVIVALALQVATRAPEGFVGRAGVAVSGVVLIFAVASLVLWLVGLA
ncbi:MAG: hypothetical protein BGO95_08535 [Micrococcales bacterium 73-13]|nr:MAG: hypothetical protein BGO95_08535 [Micrococcales bacterium 73-13]